MSRRDTQTGTVLEEMVLPALRRAGYTYDTQVAIGRRVGGRRHVVDLVAEKDNCRFLISLKWQQVSGTAEQKVPFEVISLAEAVLSAPGTRAYLVLGGEGWTLREYYTGNGLSRHLVHAEAVTILTLEGFIARVNNASL